jgi:hypothetical protein
MRPPQTRWPFDFVWKKRANWHTRRLLYRGPVYFEPVAFFHHLGSALVRMRSHRAIGHARSFGFCRLCNQSSGKLKTRNFCLESSDDPFSIHASSTYIWPAMSR